METIHKIFVILKVSFLELFHEKIMTIFGILYLILLSLFGFLDYFKPEEQLRFIQDLGITLFSFFSFLSVLFGSILLFFGKANEKEEVFYLTKPISRTEFLLGRFLGIGFFIFLGFIGMALILFLMLQLKFNQVSWNLLSILYLLALKYTIFLSLILFLATFLERLLVIFVGTFLFFLSNVIPFLKIVSEDQGNPVFNSLLFFFEVILPRFEMFDQLEVFVLGNEISKTILLQSTGYCILYIGIVFVAASLVFDKKEF